MNFLFRSSFIRLLKKLETLKQKQVLEAIEALKMVLVGGVKLERLGMKRLSKDTWEIRSSLKDRIIFTFKNDTIIFVLVGSHDDIQNYRWHAAQPCPQRPD